MTDTLSNSSQTMMLNHFEYEYLTGSWNGSKVGAAFNAVAEWCRNAGFCYRDWDMEKDAPRLTKKGEAAIKEYEGVFFS